MQELVRSSMRLRPDRIVVGEVRGAEALDLIKVWGTGHPGGIATIHSDSPMGIQRLNQEAAKAMAAASAAGIAVSETAALRWITANPAWVLGLDHVIGTLEVGKRADVVVWSGSPLSVYTLAQQVFMAGELVFDRAARPLTDFELGNSAADRAMAPPTAKPVAPGGAP